MPKTKISEFDVDPANNTDINSINIAEGCAPSGINNAIRQLMSDLKEFQQGTKGDAFLGPVSSSSLTLSSLTANRVLYTNGSKVVATSDNMQFDGTTTTLNALTVDAAFAANGGATLGNATGDALTINSSAVSIPNGLNFDSNTFVIDAGNNRVGVGTSSPAQKLHLSVSSGSVTQQFSSGSNILYVGWDNGTSNGAIQCNAGLTFNTGASYTERMRIDSSGNLLVGTTSANNLASSGIRLVPGTAGYSEFVRTSTGESSANIYCARANDGRMLAFYRNEGTLTQVGSISVTTSATAYNTSSDYRLKENIAPMTGALAFVRKQRPVTYDWRINGSKGSGYIAHWLQEDGAGNCVTGEKDAVDKDGKPVYQGIDTSFMVAPLNAAVNEMADLFDVMKDTIESQQAIITDLKARIETLESK